LNKAQKNIELAFCKGYRVVDGEVISPISGRKLKLGNKNGYYKFSIKDETNTRQNIQVHRLVAFQKFGYDAFKEEIETRHLNNDSLNNLDENIEIGTSNQNAMDKDPETRMRVSIKAASKLRKFTDKQVEEIRKKHNSGWSYKRLMEYYDISSKGTMSHIINNKYKTKII